MHEIGSDKQLFIDHRFIDSSEGVRLAVNPPVKREGAVLRADRPWDRFALGWYSIVDDGGTYKMWYYGAERDPRPTHIEGEARPLGHLTGYVVPAGTPRESLPVPGRYRLCYAESHDGLEWEKPELGLVEFDGSKRNNIVGGDFKLAYVFLDPHAPESERFKLIHWTGPGIAVTTSADGLRWDRPSRQVSMLAADTQKMAWWEPRLNRYVVYLRVMVEEDNRPMFPFVEPIDSDPPVVTPKLLRPLRAVGRVEVDDLMSPWPEEEIRTVFAADEHDPPDSDIYTHGLYRYPYAADAYFMFPMTYQHFREGESPVRNDGLNDSQFAASRDGIHWMRYDRRPYIGRGIQGEFDGGGIHGSPYLIRRGAELHQHYGGEPWTHGQYRRLSDDERRDRANWARGRSCVAVQRLDGFVSADAAYGGGTLLTPPLTFDGDRLELNIDVAAMGEARVELRDREGRPIDGFGAADCDRLTCNDVAARVRWRGSQDLGPLRGRPVRLHVRMRSAKLYAFQFVSA